MDELIAFVRARLDEDEAAASAADPGPWEVGPNPAKKGMVYIREENDLLDSVGLTWREPVFVSQVPNKTRFRENATHIARHDPARVLREVEAKRGRLALMIEAHAAMDKLLADKHAGDVDRAMAIGRARGATVAVKHDAAIWNDHPDYRQEWRP